MRKVDVEVDLVARRPSRRVPTFWLNGDLYPLLAFRSELRRRGIVFRCRTWAQARRPARGPILCIDSRALSYRDGRVDPGDLETLSALRSVYERIVWLDNRDSTGTTQFDVLPLVDIYCKKQYLRDRSLYRKSFYSGRIFTDYYHREFGIEDDEPEAAGEPLAPEYEHKLKLHWNLEYGAFGQRNRVERYAHLFLRMRPPRLVEWSATARDVDVQARYGTRYKCRTVAFQRQALLDRISQYRGLRVSTGTTSLRRYLGELARTAAVLSPFGWGEVCTRDFETFAYGAALVKPDMSHLETWPELFKKDVTYLSLPWDPDEAAERLEELLRRRDLLEEVAVRGQSEFGKLWTAEGVASFCDRFADLLGGHPGASSSSQ